MRNEVELSVEELAAFINEARDLFHSQVWPVGARVKLKLPEPKPVFCEKCGMSRSWECDELGH